MLNGRHAGRKAITALVAFFALAIIPGVLSGQIYSGYSSSSKTGGVQVSQANSPSVPKAKEQVQFYGSGTSNVTSWRWDFGDGSVSGTQNPVHVYARSGLFKVTLTGYAGTKYAKVKKTILVAAATRTADSTSDITAAFSSSPVSPLAGSPVQFTDGSTGSITKRTWSFGDGGVSTDKDPAHTYASAGTYTIILAVSNDSLTRSVSRSITVLPVVDAAFGFTPSSPGTGKTVSFTDSSTGSPTAWSWDFGDGSVSTLQNPTHAYASSGSYTVKLTVSNAVSTDSGSAQIVVASLPAGSFSYTPASPAAGQTVSFTDSSSGGPTAWSWDFGDGSASTLQNPTHAYASSGSYTVKLTVSNASGSASASKTVAVAAALSGAFTYTPASPAVGATVTFTDTSAGSPTAWSWNFGDGSTSTLQNPAHAFASSGSYPVTLTVSNASGSDSISRIVTVVATGLKAAFSYAPSSLSAGQTVKFTDASTGSPTAWLWDFGDGTSSSEQNPSHAYGTAGAYTVQLSAWSDTDLATASQTLSVSASYAITAASASRDDVEAAIASAQAGDTVIVPEGAAVWSKPLIITKGVKLIGAGAGKTVITSGYTAPNPNSVLDSTNYLIHFVPASPASNDPFRLSGFTFILNNTCYWLMLTNTTVIPMNQVRIDHNTVTNAGADWRDVLLHVYGTIYGVVDSNSFGTGYMRCNGLDSVTWNNVPYTFGSPDNMYFEDNTFASIDTMFFYGEMGGRYCARYNAFDATGSTNGLYPFSDMHGNMTSSGHNAAMGAELYNNTITCDKGVCLMDQRGGKALIFGNNVVTSNSVWTKVREEYLDSLTPPTVDTVSGQPQHVSNSYYWNNRKNGSSLFNPYVAGTVDYGGDMGVVPQENREFFGQLTSFTGASGMGVGLRSARPSTCVKGVAYWATDENVLYVASDTDTWTVLFRPYAYPHPLRTSLN